MNTRDRIAASLVAFLIVALLVIHMSSTHDCDKASQTAKTACQYRVDNLPIGMYTVSQVFSDGTALVRRIMGAHGGYSVELNIQCLPVEFATVGSKFNINRIGVFSPRRL